MPARLYITLVLGLGLWAVLAIASRVYYYRVFRGRWEGRPFNVVPYPKQREAYEAAEQRREALLRFLQGQDRGDRASAEFLESPAGLIGDVETRRSEYEESVAPWRAARYVLQLQKDHDLLAERVVDYLVIQHRLRNISEASFPTCVRLQSLPFWTSRKKYPWRVVILTHYPEPLYPLFAERQIQSWLGIGVDIQPLRGASNGEDRPESPGEGPAPQRPEGPITPQPTLTPFGACQVGNDGLFGVVGGLLRMGNNTSLGVTCRHVLTSRCQSIRWPQPVRPAKFEFTQDSPDVAFIDPASPCFTNGVTRGQLIPWTSLAEIENAVISEAKVFKSSREPDRFGVVQFAKVQGVKLGRYFYRGYHFALTPRFTSRFGIYFPLSRHFSVQGDSGSWVLTAESREWMGIVIGGLDPPNNNMTMALASHYVLEACEQARLFPTPLVPEIL